MYTIIVDFDNGEHFDVYKAPNIASMTSKVNDIVQSLTTTYYGRSSVTVEIIRPTANSIIRRFTPKKSESDGNNVFEEVI